MSEHARIWQRVSTGGQDEANQLPDQVRWCDSHQYIYDLSKNYVLHGKSASKGKHQKALDQAIADMAAGEYTVLVVWQSSRIERRGAWSAFDLARRVREAGGRIEYVQDSYLNETNDMSDVMLALAATKDRQKSEDISKQVRAAIPRIEAGGGLFGRPCWGYISEGSEKYRHRLVPTDEGRRLVPEVYARYADGIDDGSGVRKPQSLQQIADWLTAEDAGGRRWWARRVAAVLRNTTYAGYRRDAEGRIVHKCEPLVDAALWRRANDRLDKFPHKRGTARSETTALLTSVLKCGNCDGPMYRIMSGKGKSRKPCYRCAGKGPARKGCGTMITEKLLDSIADEAMLADERMITETLFVPGENHESELEEIRLQMRALAAEDLADDEYDRRLAELRAERDRLAAAPATPDKWIPRVVTDEQGRPITYARRWAEADHEDRRAMLLSQVRMRFWWDEGGEGESRVPQLVIGPLWAEAEGARDDH